MKLFVILLLCVLGISAVTATEHHHHVIEKLEARIAYLEENCLSPKAPLLSFGTNITEWTWRPDLMVQRVTDLVFGSERLALSATKKAMMALQKLPCLKDIPVSEFQNPYTLGIELFNKGMQHVKELVTKVDKVVAVLDALPSESDSQAVNIVEDNQKKGAPEATPLLNEAVGTELPEASVPVQQKKEEAQAVTSPGKEEPPAVEGEAAPSQEETPTSHEPAEKEEVEELD